MHRIFSLLKAQPLEQVWALINDMRSEAGFKGQDDRSSLICAEEFRLFPKTLLKKEIVERASDLLNRILGPASQGLETGDFGAYWLPQQASKRCEKARF